MQVIPHMHAFVSELSPAARQAFEELSTLRKVGKGEAVYRQGDTPSEVYQLVEGRVKLCNYSPEGREVVSGELQLGDCFGEMGLIDGLPRMSHAIASCDSIVRVLNRPGFDELTAKHPEVDRKIAAVLCHRVRYLYSLNEEASELTLHQRVARCVLRLAYSRESNNPERELFIAISQEERGRCWGPRARASTRNSRPSFVRAALSCATGEFTYRTWSSSRTTTITCLVQNRSRRATRKATEIRPLG